MTEAPDTGHPDLSHKVCLITGASRGIGAAAARYIAAAGATVILGARKVDSSQRVVEQIVSAGGTAEAIMLDVADDDCVAAVVGHIESTYGALHLAFNNAGTQGPAAPIHQQDPAEVARILDVNLLGVYRAMRHEIPAMLRTGSGVIVNTASVGGIVAASGIGPYCASKHGVIGLSKSAAADYARFGIRVNVLAPGAVRTEILTSWLKDEAKIAAIAEETPQGRVAEPEEIAPVVAWLLSDASSFMTGSVVTADGGYTAL